MLRLWWEFFYLFFLQPNTTDSKKERTFPFFSSFSSPPQCQRQQAAEHFFFLFSNSTLKPWNMNDIKTCIWVRGRARERKVWKSREATGFFRRRRRRKMKNNFGTRHCWREFKCERRWCASRPKSTAEREKMLIIGGLWKKVCNFTRDKKRERKTSRVSKENCFITLTFIHHGPWWENKWLNIGPLLFETDPSSFYLIKCLAASAQPRHAAVNKKLF